MRRTKKQRLKYLLRRGLRIVRRSVTHWRRSVTYRARRLKRLLFTSPAETRFIRLMGGKVIVFEWIRLPYGQHFPLTIVLSMGRIMRREHVKREVPAGYYCIDFGNDVGRGIEVDGREYHMDVIKEQKRDEALYGMGWRILHIRADELWRSPAVVQRKAIDYLCK